MGILPVNKDYDRILRDVSSMVLGDLNTNMALLRLELTKPTPNLLVIKDAVNQLEIYIRLCEKARPDLVTVANEFSNFTRAISFSSAISTLDSTTKEARVLLERAKKYI